jgi:hypothetical protein
MYCKYGNKQKMTTKIAMRTKIENAIAFTKWLKMVDSKKYW